jgi:ribonuclease P protein component
MSSSTRKVSQNQSSSAEAERPLQVRSAIYPPKQSLSHARLQKHADYQKAYARGRKRHSASMSWFLAPRATPTALDEASIAPRVGLTVGKVVGKAHERNRIKRRMREALRRHVALLPQRCDLILHPRRSVLTIEFAKLEAEVVRILQQAQMEVTRLPQEAVAP